MIEERIKEENGICRGIIIDKYVSPSKKYPNKMNTYYRLSKLLDEKITKSTYVTGESHWIANWKTEFEDVETNDEVDFEFFESEFFENGFVHNGQRIKNVRNISVHNLHKVEDES